MVYCASLGRVKMSDLPFSYAALGKAITEYALIGLELDDDRRRVGLTFLIPGDPKRFGKKPRRVLLVLLDVVRICAGAERDERIEAPAGSWTPQVFLELVQTLGSSPMLATQADLGIDSTPEGDVESWWPGRQLDILLEQEEHSHHSLAVVQETHTITLEVAIWFDGFELYDEHFARLDLAEVVDSGDRWWDAVKRGGAEMDLGLEFRVPLRLPPADGLGAGV